MARTKKSRSRTAKHRSWVRVAGRATGTTLWIGALCIVLALDFVYGFFLGIGREVAAFRQALAEERRQKKQRASDDPMREAGRTGTEDQVVDLSRWRKPQ